MKIVFAALAATVFATPAFAQVTNMPTPIAPIEPLPQTSDSVALIGKINPVCTIDAASSSVSVNLTSTAEQAAGDVTIVCNGANGSVAKVSSPTNGKLSGPNGSSFSYQVGAQGQFVAPTTAGAPFVALPAAMQFGLAPLAMKVKIVGSTGNAYAGSYTDTVTMTIAAN